MSRIRLKDKKLGRIKRRRVQIVWDGRGQNRRLNEEKNK